MASPAWTLLGVDFTSRPSARKPVTVAVGRPQAAGVELTAIEHCAQYSALIERLEHYTPWLGGFDFPFGLPRALTQSLHWPASWSGVLQQAQALGRPGLRPLFKAWCDARPAGQKFAHRACDGPAGSSPSMKWVNPPVAWMYLEGAPLLVQLNARMPGARDAASQTAASTSAEGRADRLALEAYPGLLARSMTKASYKSDLPAKQNEARAQARALIVQSLETGAHPLRDHDGGPIRLLCTAHLRRQLIEEPQADDLDAVLCLLQATWAYVRRDQGYGLPVSIDPLEGWIVSA